MAHSVRILLLVNVLSIGLNGRQVLELPQPWLLAGCNDYQGFS